MRNDWVSSPADRIFAPPMMYSNIPAAQAVVHQCKQRNIENIVISPGSRNAPLTLGFSEDPFFKCYSIVDERSAAFFALGIAQQLRTPVVLLCTSGSALLNYYPAVAEAFYSDIPLIVISADRPEYRIDIGDGQTIRQEGIFRNHIGFSASLKTDLSHSKDELIQWGILKEDQNSDEIQKLQEEVADYNFDQMNQAFVQSIEGRCPVHINVPFEEPLYGLQAEVPNLPVVLQAERLSTPQEFDDLAEYVKIWNGSERKLILCGVQHPGELDESVLNSFAKDPSVMVLTETTSNMRHPEFINSIDSILAPIELAEDHEHLFDQLKPELLVTIGGLIVSKKVKAFLRKYRPKHHWHVDKKKAFDTFQSLSEHVRMRAGAFFNKLLEQAADTNSAYAGTWAMAKSGYLHQREAYLQQIPFSDLLAFDQIFRAIPDNYQLQLANSSTVRYSQLFDMNPKHSVFCNRGTSGIDGSTSTAVGAALYCKQPTLLLSGDLSFLYDINGLWNLYLRPDFRIIVINNGGGGIFRILPGRYENGTFERFFETTHEARFDLLCNAYGLTHMVADNSESLDRTLKDFFREGERPKLLEVQTPRTLNDKILLQYFEFISSNLYD